jgi:nucleotide-binding universal stress UspA family protein
MKQINKILFPIDFAEDFSGMLPWVRTFTGKFGATLYIMFVTQDLTSYSTFYVPHGNIKSFQEEALKAASEKMAAVAQESFQDFHKLETRVAIGKPAEKILELAQKEGIDMIIMGTHGRKGLDYAIFGSVCREVIRGAKVPVVSLHPEKL